MMTYEVEVAAAAARSPREDTSVFEEEWKKCGGGGGSLLEGLEPIEEFNANFSCTSGAYINPQLLNTPLNSAGTPCPLLDSSDGQYGLEQNVNSEQTNFSPLGGSDAYSNNTVLVQPAMDEGAVAHSELNLEQVPLRPFGNLVSHQHSPVFYEQATVPYLHPSIELPNIGLAPQRQHIHTPSPCPSYLYRRSVSEPPTGPNPDDLRYHHYTGPPGAQGQMILSRPGHVIGTPESMPNDIPRPKRLLPGRPPKRYQPYPGNKQGGKEAVRFKHELRRAKTPPVRGPTSVPPSPAPPPPMMMIHESAVLQPQQMPTLQMSPLQLVSSRICTPTPSPERMPSPPPGPPNGRKPLDPANGLVNGAVEEQGTMSIPITVERLQDLITEAVQKALKSSEKETTAVQMSKPDVDRNEGSDS